jgi:predicted RNA-binding Zn-ribbon protein involved in translation (DUF1610 family)
MISELLSAVASVKALNDILKAALDLHTFNQVVATLSKVNGDLMNAQAAALKSQDEQAQLAKRVRELEDQLAATTRWETESQHYKLRALVPDVFVYEYVTTSPDTEPPHFVCPNCFQLRVRSILQLTSTWAGGKRYTCPRCNTELRAADPDYQSPVIPSPRYGGPHGWMG